jgi:hypothetical protein
MSSAAQPRRITYSLRTFLCFVALAGVGLASVLYFIGQIPASRVYEVRAEFGSMPADDDALRQWLTEQPGVIAHTCHMKREGNAVRVTFIQVRNMVGQPSFPDLESECKRLGYSGSDPVFRDYR